jgi:lipoprotein-anchoring transpeptidase ErfK/SrfK
MRRIMVLALIGGISALPSLAAQQQQKLSADAINSAEPSGKVALKSKPLLARAEILLDQHHFSPGEIDGSEGDNFKKALAEFQRVNKLKPTGKLDQETWSLLTRNGNAPAVVDYTVRDEDVKGPFVRKIPKKMEDQADLEALGYRSPLELLAEKFHMSESLLKALNPGKSFDTAGTVLAVPNLGAPEAKGPKVAKIEIDKRSHQLRALDEDGNLIAFYPASVGSKEKPAPSGKSEVTKIARNPTYTYNPKYAFRGVHSDKKFTIKSGPNNPVGLVWIALRGEGYGIHGTPDPDHVGKTASHGCIRLTNWDALDLASKVDRKTPVEFLEQ